MNAYCLLRQGPVYRREAFLQGLAAAGLNVSTRHPDRPLAGDLLVLWNRYEPAHTFATRWEAAGGRVLVAENGYLGFGGRSHRPRDPSGRRMYALAWHDHNGRGAWPRQDSIEPLGGRFLQLGVELKAWRAGGRRILVCAQRGVGSPGRASPPAWAEQVAAEIRRLHRELEVVIRPHPGDDEPAVPLERDLETAAACVIWASGAGVKALVEGVPVFHACPWWICSAGARRYTGPACLVTPAANDVMRAVAVERMAWGQWTCDEISSGEPFRRLLELPYPIPRQREAANAA